MDTNKCIYKYIYSLERMFQVFIYSNKIVFTYIYRNEVNGERYKDIYL